MAKPIRILHVLGGLNRAGAETMVINLYRNIDRTKVQFDFIVHTKDKCDYDDEIRSLGGRIFSVPRYTGKNHFQYTKAWSDFFKQYPEYKIVHGHVRSTAWIYLEIAKKNNLITIAHSHSTSSGSGLSAIVKGILQYPIRYTADYLLACSNHAGTWLFGKKACRKDNFFIIKNAIDTKKFIYNEDIRTKKRNDFQFEDKFVIGHIGRFDVSKNHEFLIDIFQAVHKRNNNAVLMMVGDGDLRQSIEKKVNNLKLTDSVVFTGVRSDIPELLQAMDVFVFPSLYEGLGIVTVEAQAAGLNCVVADTIPNEAFLTDLIKAIPLGCHVEEWSDAILSSNGNKKQGEIHEKIKNAGYDIAQNVKKMEDFYFRIVGL
ncbi:glycosyltransferase family 1 protein [Niallia oryzisoli]|uniref:glycosyltransferase family 1 protein n=1 Tax=Niallia oryzisoli TaxID=1737571 RepID=UPI003736FEFD